MGLFSRLPNSNDIPKDLSNPWGSRNPELYDDIAVLIGKRGERCSVCNRVVLNEYLNYKDGKNYCPDHKPK